MKIRNLGLVKDPRSRAEKKKDFKHSELAGMGSVNWVEKTIWKSFTPRNQFTSSSCVGQGTAKGMETFLKDVFSAHPQYRSRSNFPGKGMYLAQACDILKHQGTTTEALDVSQGLTEDQMNAKGVPATPVKIGAYVFVDKGDIDGIAEAIELYGHCVLTFDLNRKEWTATPKASAFNFNFDGHCICAVDYGLVKGVKTLAIEDSIGIYYQKNINEAFLKARSTGAVYMTPIATISKPHVTLNRDLTYGMEGDDVRMLQDVLKYEGLFNVPSTGKFYTITAHALVQFQVKNGIFQYIAETDMTKVRCGKLTRSIINNQYS